MEKEIPQFRMHNIGADTTAFGASAQIGENQLLLKIRANGVHDARLGSKCELDISEFSIENKKLTGPRNKTIPMFLRNENLVEQVRKAITHEYHDALRSD